MLKQLARNVPLWGWYLAVALTLLLAFQWIPQDDVFPAGQVIENPGEASISMLQEILKLIMTLATALLGAAAAVIVKSRDWSGGWTRVEVLLVIIVFICGAVSYYGVYLSHIAVLTMVSHGVVYSLESSLLWGLRLSFFGLVGGALLLGLLFSLMLERIGGSQMGGGAG